MQLVYVLGLLVLVVTMCLLGHLHDRDFKTRFWEIVSLVSGFASTVALLVWASMPFWVEMNAAGPTMVTAVAAFDESGRVTSDSDWLVFCHSRCINFLRTAEMEVRFTRPDARIVTVHGQGRVTDAARYFATDGLFARDRIVTLGENHGRLVRAVHRQLYNFAAERMNEFSRLANPLDPEQFEALKNSVTKYVNDRLHDRGTEISVTSFDLR